MVLFAVIIINILIRCFWGWATYTIIARKGYYENWFWWGFFFTLIALVVAITKQNISVPYTSPEYAQTQKAKYDSAMLQEDGWQCSRCGRTNPGYTGTCGCGLSKAESETWLADADKVKRETAIAQAIQGYKGLLDSGAISQDEFDKKKAELLNIVNM